MFIDGYDKICKARGLSPTSVLRDLGISKGTYTNWESGRGRSAQSDKEKNSRLFQNHGR